MSELWKIVGNGGIKVYDDPEDLWNKAEAYFLYCDTTPITSKRTIQSGKGVGSKVDVENVRPYSLKGLCLFCGVNESWLKDIAGGTDNNSIWFLVVEKIMYVIYNQNVEGAYVDLFNPIMVSKILGLDKPEDNSGKITKIEIVESISTKLANSENEILKNLNYEKLVSVKEKSENLKRENLTGKHLDGSEDEPYSDAKGTPPDFHT